MSWFLISGNKKKTKAKRGSSAKTGTWDPQRTLAAVKLLLILTVAIGAGYGWRFGREALRDYTRDRAPMSITADRVILADAPPWMGDALSARLRGLVAAELYHQPLEGDALARAVGVLRESPWVETVHRIERSSLAEVIVRADYRRPVAMVEGTDGYHLVDAYALRLPGVYHPSQRRKLGLPLIVGPRTPPPPIGKIWDDNTLRAGLALRAQLARTSILGQIASIDVSHRDERGRPRLVLWTDQGRDLARSPHIIWGLPPGAENPYEPDLATKVARLAVVIRRDSAREKIVDISGAAVWQHEPLGGDVIQSAEYTTAW